MTIASQTSRITYTGDAVTTAFAVPFYFSANADLVVYLQDTLGTQFLQALGTHYNLTGATLSAGGTCTFVTAPPTGYLVSIYRDPPLTQTTSYNNNDPFPAKAHELALDKALTIEQRSRDMVGRALHLSDGDTAAVMTIPTKPLRLNKSLAFDSSGLPVAISTIGPPGPSGGAQFFQTRAQAAGSTISTSLTSITIYQFATNYPFAPAIYIPGTSAGPMAFQEVGGHYWELDLSSGTASVLWFGAICDGATSDTTAWNNAITWAHNRGGRILIAPAGKTSLIDGTLVPKSFVWIMAYGHTFSIATVAPFKQTAATQCYSFSLQGASIVAQSAPYISATVFDFCCLQASRLQDLSFTGFTTGTIFNIVSVTVTTFDNSTAPFNTSNSIFNTYQNWVANGCSVGIHLEGKYGVTPTVSPANSSPVPAIVITKNEYLGLKFWNVGTIGVWIKSCCDSEDFIGLDVRGNATTLEVMRLGDTTYTGNNYVNSHRIHVTASMDGAVAVSMSFFKINSMAFGNLIDLEHDIDFTIVTCALFTLAGGVVTNNYELNGKNIDSSITNISTVEQGSGKYYQAGLGSNTRPTYSFSGDAGTGIYSAAAGEISASIAGVKRLQITATNFVIIGDIPGAANDAAAAAAGVPLRGLYRNSGAVMIREV